MLLLSDGTDIPRSTMAWGLEARVPFLDKAFLEVAMNIDPAYKMFNKGSTQEVDEDGRPRMEKVIAVPKITSSIFTHVYRKLTFLDSILFARPLILLLKAARYVYFVFARRT